jgi:hypothetical protein
LTFATLSTASLSWPRPTKSGFRNNADGETGLRNPLDLSDLRLPVFGGPKNSLSHQENQTRQLDKIVFSEKPVETFASTFSASIYLLWLTEMLEPSDAIVDWWNKEKRLEQLAATPTDELKTILFPFSNKLVKCYVHLANIRIDFDSFNAT